MAIQTDLATATDPWQWLPDEPCKGTRVVYDLGHGTRSISGGTVTTGRKGANTAVIVQWDTGGVQAEPVSYLLPEAMTAASETSVGENKA